MNTCEKCRYYMASPLQEPCESCHWDGVIGHDPPNWKRPTNGDSIRAMSDEKLASLFGSTCDCDNGCCFIRHEGVSCMNGCEAAWLEWLKEEVKE